MADTVYRYCLIAPTAAKIEPLINLPIGGVLVIGAPSVDMNVDVLIDDALKDQLDYAMGLYNYEYIATAPPAVVALPAAYSPLVEVQAAPVAGRVLQVDWYQSYPPGGPGVGLARRRVDTWIGPKLIQTTITDYWIDGTPIGTRTYDYETTATGERVEQES
jgi:hypothetical protein